ncbi:unnamed protein product, partial [Ectocarpus sp. 12 AP-2014]
SEKVGWRWRRRRAEVFVFVGGGGNNNLVVYHAILLSRVARSVQGLNSDVKNVGGVFSGCSRRRRLEGVSSLCGVAASRGSRRGGNWPPLRFCRPCAPRAPM